MLWTPGTLGSNDTSESFLELAVALFHIEYEHPIAGPPLRERHFRDQALTPAAEIHVVGAALDEPYLHRPTTQLPDDT